MKELHKILTDSISSDKGINVTIDRKIPKTTIGIHQSQTMILYGIGKKDEMGFALCISVDNKSNKGKRIIEELTMDEILKGFKTFDNKGSTIFVADFKADVDLIVNKANEVLVRLTKFTPDIETKFNQYSTNATYTLK